MAPNLTVRVTEAAASAFHARLAADDTGTRFRLQFAELPAGSRIFAPDAVAGNDATAPTGSGLLLQLLQAGTYTPGAGSLLLVRVTGAAPDGTGGTLAWTSVAGANQLSVATIREADVTSAGEAYMIYEVADSNAANVESAELPLYAFAGPTNSNGVFPAHATLDIVPNATESAAAAASVPRYQAPIAVGPDCLALGDCQAHYFPSLKVATYNTNPHFTLQFGSRRISGLLGVGNLGRGVATWQASVEYNSKLGKNQSSWIQLPTTSGFTQTSNSFIFNIDPSQLSAGQYGGRIIFTQTNAPDGSQPQFNQAIQLTVLPSLSQKQ